MYKLNEQFPYKVLKFDHDWYNLSGQVVTYLRDKTVQNILWAEIRANDNETYLIRHRHLIAV